ncbi:hypothetical protein NDU88_005091 [Pleurodeles waltl]|uniref:Uncharacterized protein n=1 Tax=Pleurodeles waltl TaxID=8319 RepID=A0AAV7PHW1_PLEWA|nr:hypothetical protein NDU88_005091 [Pleurodeles waltl]
MGVRGQRFNRPPCSPSLFPYQKKILKSESCGSGRTMPSSTSPSQDPLALPPSLPAPHTVACGKILERLPASPTDLILYSGIQERTRTGCSTELLSSCVLSARILLWVVSHTLQISPLSLLGLHARDLVSIHAFEDGAHGAEETLTHLKFAPSSSYPDRLPLVRPSDLHLRQ